MAENKNIEPGDAEASAGKGAVSQDDIDALFADAGAAGGTDPQAPAAAPQAAAGDSGAGSQSDIDALLSAAQEEAEAPPGDSTPPAEDERVDAYGSKFDQAAAAMATAIEEEKAAAQPADAVQPVESAQPAPQTSTFQMPELAEAPADAAVGSRLDMLMDVNLRVKIELGRTSMLVEEVLKLGEGSVVELDKLAGDPVDVYVNDRLIARGEVLVLNDVFCVRVNEVLSRDPHRIGAA